MIMPRTLQWRFRRLVAFFMGQMERLWPELGKVVTAVATSDLNEKHCQAVCSPRHPIGLFCIWALIY